MAFDLELVENTVEKGEKFNTFFSIISVKSYQPVHLSMLSWIVF